MDDCLTAEAVRRYQTAEGLSVTDIEQIDRHLAACAACRARLRAAPGNAAQSIVAELLPDPTDYPCPEEETVTAYAEGRLPGVDREVVEQHLQNCARCRADVDAHTAFLREAAAIDWSALPKRPWSERARDRFDGACEQMKTCAAWLGRTWSGTALSARILTALVLGSLAGELIGPRMREIQPVGVWILNLLTAVAIPLIFVAIVHALLRTELVGQKTGRLITLLLTNSFVAACIGLALGNILRPDQKALQLEPHVGAANSLKIPTSLLQPLVENNLLLVILFALGFGTALRFVREDQIRSGSAAYRTIEDLIETAFRCLLLLLRWIIGLIPVAVLVIASDLVGRQGLAGFAPSIHLVAATLLGLLLLGLFYLVRLKIATRTSPIVFLVQARSALLTAFSTASSAATLPVSYAVARDRMQLHESSASLGVLIGGSVNRDGTALFEALAVLAITHALHVHLGWQQQGLLLVMAVVASICAPGIPMAGLVTMVLIFQALGLPGGASYIIILLPLDWLLDRFRTSLNVMGHLTVASLLDANEPQRSDASPASSEISVLPPRAHT